MKDFKKWENNKRQTKMFFSELFHSIRSPQSELFSNWERFQVVRKNGQSPCYPSGPEKMFVLSKICATVVPLIRTFFFLLHWMRGQPFDGQTFVPASCLSEGMSQKFTEARWNEEHSIGVQGGGSCQACHVDCSVCIRGSGRHIRVPWWKWLVRRFRSERLRVRSRRSATFTPSAHACKKAVFACLATDVKQDAFTFTFTLSCQ